MERKPPRPRRVSEGSSEHEVYLPTGALSPNRQTRDPLPDTLLKRVKQFSGRLSTEAIASMEDRLPFFGDLDAAQPHAFSGPEAMGVETHAGSHHAPR